MRLVLSMLALVCVVGGPSTMRADEGMWTLNNFPSQKVAAKYGFAPDQKWLDHVRLASLRLTGGCSGSFVSPEGLVLTNHHCAQGCITQLSTAQRDLFKNGFSAKILTDEPKCPAIEINQLIAITDVTARMQRATRNLTGKAYNDAQKAEMARIEKECGGSPKLRCDVVTLYHGGVYNLYKYRRFQDVRLVFAPEFAIAFFGGDPDNFMFPRYDLDMTLLRVYEDGKPLATPEHFRWSPAGAKDLELTFITGQPGGTSRHTTVAELEYERDLGLPRALMRIAEWRGILEEFGRRGAEQRRISTHDLFLAENSYKALKGQWEALLDKPFFATKVAEERALRGLIAKDAARQKAAGGAFDAIAKAVEKAREVRKPYGQIEGFGGKTSRLFGFARNLVRGAEERTKPNEKRYPEFRDAALPAITQRLFSRAPIYDEMEILSLTFSLEKMREVLGADHPFVRKVLGKESPEELATRLVKGTKLKDPAVRRSLWDGGQAAVAASGDPLIRLARLIDPDARAVRKQHEDEIESVKKKAHEQLAKARFEVYGTDAYPDATFTLRVTYGQIKGYREDGRVVRPFTDFAGAFARDTGRPPFDLPASWHRARPRLNLKTPFNFCSDNDIIGGNSGSPVINRKAEIVGVVFDGNIQSLGGDYGFDAATNRAVVLDSRAILEALRVVYGADRLVKELQGKR